MTEIYKPDGTVSEEPDPPKQPYSPPPRVASQQPQPTADRILRHLSPIWLIIGFLVVSALYPWFTTGVALFVINLIFWVIVAVVGSIMQNRPVRSFAIGALLAIATLMLFMLLIFGACFVLAG